MPRAMPSHENVCALAPSWNFHFLGRTFHYRVNRSGSKANQQVTSMDVQMVMFLTDNEQLERNLRRNVPGLGDVVHVAYIPVAP